MSLKHILAHQKKPKTLVSDNMVLSLLTLPVEMIYRILDQINDKALFLSARNVCQRLNTIIDSYHRYQVKSDVLSFSKNFSLHQYKRNTDLSLYVRVRLNKDKYVLIYITPFSI